MTNPSSSGVDRLVHALCACVAFLTVLFLWQRTHERSCLSLAFPLTVMLATAGGILEYKRQRKRFLIDYYLARGSPLRHWIARSRMSVLTSLATAAPLAAFLAVFTARARPADWFFLCGATAAAPLLFSALRAWPGSHLREHDRDERPRAAIADILTARVTGTLLLGALAAAYVWTSYYVLPVPGHDIFPDSLERTLGAFAANAGSACPVVDNTLQLASELEALSWYFVTTSATSAWMHDGVALILWLGFFLNTAMVFGGFVRGLEGSILGALWLERLRLRK